MSGGLFASCKNFIQASPPRTEDIIIDMEGEEYQGQRKAVGASFCNHLVEGLVVMPCYFLSLC